MWFWLGGSSKGAAADDSKELLSQLRVITDRPPSDRDLTDAKGYLFLSHAQTALTYRLAAHIPDVLRLPPEKMATSDGGITYQTKFDILGHAEIYPGPQLPPLIEGPYWDGRADYTREGPRSIRFLRARSFPDGPYARYVAKPGVIDDVSQPTLQPTDARRILPWLAAALWAEAGGTADPSPYLRTVERLLWGDPSMSGDIGLIPSYKTQHFTGSLSGRMTGRDLWWRSPDLDRSTL